jgi:hypothetical protein
MPRSAIGSDQHIAGLNDTAAQFKPWQRAIGKDDQTGHKIKNPPPGEDKVPNKKLPPPV